MIAAVAASFAPKPEARAARMLVGAAQAVFAVAPDSPRKRLLDDAQDAVYSPDGTQIAFTRAGDLWTANADGSGQRRLLRTPSVLESRPAWRPDGLAVAYTARVDGSRQIRLFTLPTGPSRRLATGGGEQYDAAFAPNGRLAFVSTGGGSPAVEVARGDGTGAAPFDAAPAATPPADIGDLAWSRDGSRLAYTAVAADGTTSVVLDDGTSEATFAAGSRPVWSPQGTRIALADPSGNLASVGADGTDPRVLGAGTPLDWRTVPVGHALYPNLVQRPPSGLVVTRTEHGHWLLGFTSMVDNRGPGVLWITGTRAPGAHTMQVHQLLQVRGRAARVLPASGELHYTVAPPHYHWHFLGFDHYELRRAGDFSLLVRDHKSGFCLADHYGIAQGIPHGPPRFLGDCAQFHPRARFVVEGSSVGYTDRYPAFFHGQALDITNVPPGRYWLVHRANSDFHLREAHYGDDTASLLIRLERPAGVPHVTELRSCSAERC